MAYSECKWCYGNGCNQCETERRKAVAKWEKDGPQPIFTAKLDDPDAMQALNRVCGREALVEAFGPDGRGVKDIELNACIENMLDILKIENPIEG